MLRSSRADTAKVPKAWKEGLAASMPVKVDTAFVDSKVKFNTVNVPTVKKGKERKGRVLCRQHQMTEMGRRSLS